MWQWLKNLFKKKEKTIIPDKNNIVEFPKPPNKIDEIQTFQGLGTPKWYVEAWNKCVIEDKYKSWGDRPLAKILKNKDKFLKVQDITGVPWEVVAAIHFRESSLNFNTCLHNGDPLPGPTIHVPAGRGPFASWEDAAIDSIKYEGFDKVTKWDLATCLKKLEAYNGGGYLKRGLPSPYLWACTNVSAHKGYYIEDGKFYPYASCDEYLGAAAILKLLNFSAPVKNY